MKVAAAGLSSGFASRLRGINLRPSVDPASSGGTGGENSGSPATSSQSRNAGPSSPSKGVAPRAGTYGSSGEAPVGVPSDASGESGTPESSAPGASNESELSESEQRTLRELQRVDDQVRSHEQAHLAAAGPYAQGGISLQYVTGPDGQRYAVGGSVELDTGKARTPEETIRKMQRVKQAATAPANPSAQDQRVAAQAARKLAEARSKLQESQGNEDSAGTGGTSEAPGRDSGSSDASESSSESTPGSGGGFERAGDIGVDVDDGTGTYIADRTGQSTASVSSSNDTSSAFSGSSLRNQFVTGTPNTAASSGRVMNVLA